MSSFSALWVRLLAMPMTPSELLTFSNHHAGQESADGRTEAGEMTRKCCSQHEE